MSGDLRLKVSRRVRDQSLARAAELEAENARLREAMSEDALRKAIHAWIAKDAPVSIKMTMAPVLVQALVNRIAH
ncbi:hypothetical protein [Methylobacterium sp. Gmos1]